MKTPAEIEAEIMQNVIESITIRLQEDALNMSIPPEAKTDTKRVARKEKR